MTSEQGGRGRGKPRRGIGAPQRIERDEATRRLLAETIGAALAVRPDRIATATRGTARTAFARQLAIYLARTRLGLSFTEAGRLFRRDRTTAAHACRRIEESRDDVAIDALIEGLEALIAGSPGTRAELAP